MTEPNQPQGEQRGIQIEVPAQGVQANYSNLAFVGHTPNEVTIDFAQVLPQLMQGPPRAVVCAKVILTPHNAKALLEALQENINRYEQQFGRINIPGRPPQGGKGNIGFNA